MPPKRMPQPPICFQTPYSFTQLPTWHLLLESNRYSAQHVQNRNFQPQTASLTAFLISIKCHFILPVAQVQIFMSALVPLCVSSPISNLTPIPTFHTWAKLPCLSHHPSLLGGNAAIASHIVSLFHLAHLQSLPNRMWSWKRQVILPHLSAPSLPMIPTSLEEKSVFTKPWGPTNCPSVFLGPLLPAFLFFLPLYLLTFNMQGTFLLRILALPAASACTHLLGLSVYELCFST